MADEEAIACRGSAGLVFCALGVHTRNIKKQKHAACERDFLTDSLQHASTRSTCLSDTFDTARLVAHDKSSSAKMN